MPNLCGACSANNATMKCGACKASFYCNRECQLKHWREGHKHECKLLQNRNQQNADDEKFEFTLPSLDEETKAMIRIEKVPGKGYGVIANCDIKKGTIIYREEPLMVLSNGVSRQVLEQSIKCQFAALSNEQQNLYKSLSKSHLAKAMDLRMIAINNRIDMPTESEQYGASKQSGVFPLISRINHSCECNVYWKWMEQFNEERLVAVCDIPIGSELTACYVADKFDQRQKRLKAIWNIECQCNWCKTGKKESVLKRYQEMNDILPTMGSKPNEGYKMSQELIKMTETHLNSHPNYLQSHYYDTAQFALGLQRWSEAAYYLDLNMKEKRVAQGGDVVMDELFKAKVEMLPNKFRFKFKKYEKPGLLKTEPVPEMKEEKKAEKKAKPSRKVKDNNQQKRKKGSKKQKQKKRKRRK